MKDKHVAIAGSAIQFCFKGKKGIEHSISLKSRKLANVVRVCRDIPGKELFQYYTKDRQRKSIDSGMGNQYIKQTTGMEFTAKDFRTWAVSPNILFAFKSIGEFISDSESKKKITEALEEVSKKLGNTRTVCRKYYVHPGLIRLYEERNLEKYISKLDKLEEPEKPGGLTGSEQVLMKILKNLQE